MYLHILFPVGRAKLETNHKSKKYLSDIAHVFDVRLKKIYICFLDCDKYKIKAVMSGQIALGLDFCYL